MNTPLETHSPTIGELASNLAKVQAEMPLAELDATNPFFKSKYTSLAGFKKISVGPLTKHGFAVTQFITIVLECQQSSNNEFIVGTYGGNALQTMLIHSSGEYLISRVMLRPIKDDIQSLGSYLTYMKRYMYASIIGCVSGDEDDDGESTTSRAPYYPKRISNEQLTYLMTKLSGNPKETDKLLEVLKIKNLSDMPETNYASALRFANQFKSK